MLTNREAGSSAVSLCSTCPQQAIRPSVRTPQLRRFATPRSMKVVAVGAVDSPSPLPPQQWANPPASSAHACPDSMSKDL